jgi:hypothetical protein
MTPNQLRMAERILHATFRRIDADGGYVFEFDHSYEVSYTLAQLEEELTGVRCDS